MERQLAQARVLEGLDPVFAPGPGTVPGIKERDVPAWCVGEERRDPVPVHVKERGLRPGMQGFGPQIQPCAFRVALELDDLGCVDDPRIVALVSVLVQGLLPMLLVIDPVDEALVGDRQRERGGELQPQGVQVVQEFAGGPGAVGAHQDPLGGQVPVPVAHLIGQLGQGLGEDGDVVLRGVGGLVSGAQHRGQDLPGPVAQAVIDAREHRGEPVTALVGAGAALFFGVRGDECGIDVDDQWVQPGGQRGGIPCPCRLPDPGTQPPAEGGKAVGECLVLVGGTRHEPGHRRVRRHLAEEPGAVAQHVQVRDVLPAAGKHHRQGTEDPARPVHGTLGDELGEAVLTQGPETGRIQEGRQHVQPGVGNQ